MNLQASLGPALTSTTSLIPESPQVQNQQANNPVYIFQRHLLDPNASWVSPVLSTLWINRAPRLLGLGAGYP